MFFKSFSTEFTKATLNSKRETSTKETSLFLQLKITIMENITPYKGFQIIKAEG